MIWRPWREIRRLKLVCEQQQDRLDCALGDYRRIKAAMHLYFQQWPKAHHTVIGCLCGKDHP